jgi:hypothetical protein
MQCSDVLVQKSLEIGPARPMKTVRSLRGFLCPRNTYLRCSRPFTKVLNCSQFAAPSIGLYSVGSSARLLGISAAGCPDIG